MVQAEVEAGGIHSLSTRYTVPGWVTTYSSPALSKPKPVRPVSNALFIGFGAGALVGIGVGIAGIIVGLSSDEAQASVVPLVSPTTAGLLVQTRF